MTSALIERAALAADGTRLHLEGTGTAGCLMLHGLGYAGWEADGLRAVLEDTAGLWSLDNRGTGQSGDLIGESTISLLADDAARAVEQLGGPLVIIGHSMGGYIAQTLALEHPHTVAGLVLIGTSAGGRGSVPVPESTVDAWQAAAGLAPDEYARRTMPLSLRPGWVAEHPDSFERLLVARLAHPTPQATWRAQFAACEDFLAVGADASRQTVPTLVIHGALDRIVPVDNGRRLAQSIRGARYLEVPDAGHVVHLEQPRLVAGAIAAFLTELHPIHH